MKKVLTIILDGFGLRNSVHGNAVKLAKMPNFKELWNKYGINKMDMNDFENMFGAGEFPIINIFRKNNNVIYNITR